MSTLSAASVKWRFTRPDPPETTSQYFRDDLRLIAGQQTDYNLPWQDDIYLAYPTIENPNWPAFVAEVIRLNEEADADTYHKIVYIIRRAHKSPADATILDPPVDDEGEQECAKLSENLTRAMKVKGIPPAEVIVTSPLARALRTTQVGVATVFSSVTPLVLENLREKLDGTAKHHRHSKEWIQQHFPTFQIDEIGSNDQLGSTYAQSIEPYEALWSRVRGAFIYIFENFQEALVVALVSHCHVEQTIQREITGWDVPESERREKVEFYVGDSGVYAIIVKGVYTN